MEIIADLHIHSRFSIATGQEADLEHLDLWGRYKGVQMVGTGDCTHPGWLEELHNKLEPAGEGVYTLKPALSLPLNLTGPHWEAVPPVRFVITGEVSSIYKKGGRVRKVHLLLLLSCLGTATGLSQRLSRLGNVAADGRPILGLDAKHILEVVLEIDPAALVVPAHIWTPWFSVLGAKSGFDCLEECFDDLVSHIYALETGLSSDPPMNWRVSGLDRFLLISNSDAHSPQKLGREANVFHVPPTYPDLARAIRSQEGFGGTLEFFPQEGKYHLDGHRKCGLRLTPPETKRWGGKCPQCGKRLTTGVVHRVEDLADRPEGRRPVRAQPFESLIALPEVLGEVLEVGSASKKVRQLYFRLLEKLGPELTILRRTPLAAAAREGDGVLAHALGKMRRGEVHIAGGYDGVYGEIRLLSPEERRKVQGQGAFWEVEGPDPEAHGPGLPAGEVPSEASAAGVAGVSETAAPPSDWVAEDPLLADLNPAQRLVVTHQGPPLIVQAGPGTGKTRALTHRLAYLCQRHRVRPDQILALTFTRQAAAEMAGRVNQLLPGCPELEGLTIKTFHALGHQILSEAGQSREVAEEERRRSLMRQVARSAGVAFAALEKQIISSKQALKYPEDSDPEEAAPMAAACRAYEAALAEQGLWDYEDLVARPARLLLTQPELQAAYRRRFRYLLVDEYQDLNEAQYRLFRALAGPEADLVVIGDPHQAIYGFRGARPEFFGRFQEDWPEAVSVCFTETYRLPPPVLRAAQTVLRTGGVVPDPMICHTNGEQPVMLLEEASEAAEAQAIARQIEKLMGGLSHRGLEEAEVRYQDPDAGAGFREVAVLYRFHALGRELERALLEAGIPCQQAREGVGPEWEGLDLAAEKVKLLTLHAAKGLEFPYVFIAGCEAGLIPWEPEGGEKSDPAEEQRLFYVGLTRAGKQVFLSRARTRLLWGRKRRTRLSPLVEAMGPEKIVKQKLRGTSGRPSGQALLFPEFKGPKGRRPK